VLPKCNRWRHLFTPFAARAWLGIKVSFSEIDADF
jgi:hypothetical protein